VKCWACSVHPVQLDISDVGGEATPTTGNSMTWRDTLNATPAIAIATCHVIRTADSRARTASAWQTPGIYRVGQKKLSHTLLSISSPNIDEFQNFFTCTFRGTFVINSLLRIYNHILAVSLHYSVKYKFSKITIITVNTYAKTYLIRIFLFKLNYF